VVFLQHFGEIFRKIREGRNLSMKQVVGKAFTVATLSSFEKGKSELSVAKFYYILERLAITLEEFEYISNGHEFNDFYQLLNKLSMFYTESNERSMKNLLVETESKIDDGNPQDVMTFLLVKSILSQFDVEYTLTEKETFEIADYLLSFDDWAYYQLILYSNTMKSLNLKTIDYLSKELLKRSSFYKSIPRNKKLIVEILINTTLVLAERKEFYLANFFKNTVAELLSDETMVYEKTVFLFVCGFIDFHSVKIELGMSKMQDAIGIFDKVGSHNLAKSYQEDYDEIVAEG
jgi:Rgg/GadR/MutR family transcriptional activator